MSNQDELIKRLTRFYREAGGDVLSIHPVWDPGKQRTARWLQPVLVSVALVALVFGLAVTIRLVREEAHRPITPLPISSATPSPSPSGSATATASPSATTVPTGWRGYVSSHWLYSLAYPATWYDLPNYGVPDSQKYFSNQNVPAPLAMEPGGVWLTISVDPQPGSSCSSSSDPNAIASPITIDGEATTKYLTAPPNYQSSMWAAVTHYGWCYKFTFITYSQKTRDQNMGDMDAILTSFRFNR